MSTSIKAKELKTGDIAQLKPHPGLEGADSKADWRTVRRVIKKSTCGGYRIKVYVEGFVGSFWCYLRGSSMVRVQNQASATRAKLSRVAS